jgi:hypothetical protein
MKFVLAAALVLVVGAFAWSQAKPAELTIYAIDTEGGQSTLYVSSAGGTVLFDTGFPGDRDAGRILDALKDAGVHEIDYMVTSHYDGDHVGGMKAISDRIPIHNFVDHGTRIPEGGQLTGFQATYPEIYAKGKRLIAKPGDKLAVKGFDVLVVTSDGEVLKKPLPGAGKPNPECASFKEKDEEPDENIYSVGLLITLGKFRDIDLGDFVWNAEGKLMCPNNPIGTVDLYQTSHHGSDRSGSPVLVHALHPLVAIMNNGANKGGMTQPMATIESSPGLEDFWALHWSAPAGLEYNPPGRFIANLETPEATADFILHPPPPQNTGARPRGAPPIVRAPGAPGRQGGGGGQVNHTPAFWIKVVAKSNGEFTVTNPRNNFSKTYQGGPR